MSTKKLQILGSLGNSDADTLDGKHADEFALTSDVEELKTKVGDTSVSEQINNAIESEVFITVEDIDAICGDLSPDVNMTLTNFSVTDDGQGNVTING